MENKLNFNSESVPKTLEQWFKILVDNGAWEDDVQSVKIIRSAYPDGIPQNLRNVFLNLYALEKKYRDMYFDFYIEQHLKYLFDLAQQQYEIDNPKPYFGQVIKKIKKLYTYVRNKRLWYDEGKLISFLNENFEKEKLYEFLGQTLMLSDVKIKRYKELYAEFTTIKDEETKLKRVITLALNNISEENSLRVAKISDAEQSDNLTVSVNLSATSEQKTDLEPSDNASIIQDNCNALKENNLENKESDSHDTEKMSQSISYDEVDVKASDIEKRKKKKSIRTSPDHEQSQITAKESGDKGEEIVLQYEKDKLKTLNIPDDKINSVLRVSLISDDYGYDIVSYDELGQEIYIEVKSTRKGLGNIDFFYTDNELQTAKRLKDKYKIYLVFDVLGNNPIIRNIGNPIVNNKVTIKPIQYSVNVRID